MRKLVNFTLLIALLWAKGSLAQITIDISTGKTGSAFLPINSSIPPNSFDDDWTVNTPMDPPTLFLPAPIGSGQYPLSNVNTTYAGKSPNVRWLTPALNANGTSISAPSGDYFFKRTFFYKKQIYPSTCGAPLVQIKLTHHLADNNADFIYVNGFPHALPNNPTAPIGLTYIQIPYSELINGVNSLVVRVNNYNLFVGLEIDGEIQIYKDFSAVLTNLAGEPQDLFCFDEDILLNLTNAGQQGCTLELMQQSTNLLLGSSLVPSNVNPINIKNQFSSFNFLPGVNYRIKISIITSCGTISSYVDFKLKCCDSNPELICCEPQPDAEFVFNFSGNSQVNFSSSSSGAHTYQIFSTPNVNAGPYQLINTSSNSSGSFLGSPELCYLIKHKVITKCGEACVAKTICDVPCEGSVDCPINSIVSPTINANNYVTWTPITNASYYVVEVTYNDPACCSSSGATNIGPQSYTVSCCGFQITLPWRAKCASVTVYAVCPNGTRSSSSIKKCVSGGAEGRNAATDLNSDLGAAIVNSKMELNLQPNPSSGDVMMTIKSSAASEFDLFIYNSNGQSVIEYKSIRMVDGYTSQKLPTEALKNGVYMVQVRTNEAVVNKILVIE